MSPQASVSLSLESEVDPRPSANRIYFVGQAPGGVLVGVTRQFTAGDQLLPQIVDGLITHVDAGRERGRNELSAAGPGERVTVTAPRPASGSCSPASSWGS